MSKTKRLTTKILLTDLKFPEGPRWHDGKLWFSDMEDCKVIIVDMKGNKQIAFDVPNKPSGLGWLPDGRLLVASMKDRKLFRQNLKGLEEVADLSKLATFDLNDMVVDKQGRAYIGNFGFDYLNHQPYVPANIVMVSPDETVKVVAEDMAFPNGMIITPDDKTLIVAETFSARLTAFNIRNDGTLKNRQIWANLKSIPPDGICLDEEGGIWVAAPGRHRTVRVLEGGEITHVVKVQNDAYACMLGGPDLTTLFIATAAYTRDKGQIEYVEVNVPKAGLP
ncbi:MAG: SMP-30/gluconolactonase/LRE family protein [Promethearchaeota archaeon]